jgi:hypothetical protein
MEFGSCGPAALLEPTNGCGILVLGNRWAPVRIVL